MGKIKEGLHDAIEAGIINEPTITLTWDGYQKLLKEKTNAMYDLKKANKEITRLKGLLYDITQITEVKEDAEFSDKHFNCPAYPQCYEDPNGCFIVSGKDTELYGHGG